LVLSQQTKHKGASVSSLDRRTKDEKKGFGEFSFLRSGQEKEGGIERRRAQLFKTESDIGYKRKNEEENEDGGEELPEKIEPGWEMLDGKSLGVGAKILYPLR